MSVTGIMHARVRTRFLANDPFGQKYECPGGVQTGIVYWRILNMVAAAWPSSTRLLLYCTCSHSSRRFSLRGPTANGDGEVGLAVTGGYGQLWVWGGLRPQKFGSKAHLAIFSSGSSNGITVAASSITFCSAEYDFDSLRCIQIKSYE